MVVVKYNRGDHTFTAWVSMSGRWWSSITTAALYLGTWGSYTPSTAKIFITLFSCPEKRNIFLSGGYRRPFVFSIMFSIPFLRIRPANVVEYWNRKLLHNLGRCLKCTNLHVASSVSDYCFQTHTALQLKNELCRDTRFLSILVALDPYSLRRLKSGKGQTRQSVWLCSSRCVWRYTVIFFCFLSKSFELRSRPRPFLIPSDKLDNRLLGAE